MTSEQIYVTPPAGLTATFVRGYLERLRTRLQDFRAAVDGDDLKYTCVFGHDLKGTGGAYGVPRLSEIGCLIEQDSKRGSLTDLRSRLIALEEYLKRVEVIAE